MGLWEGLTQAGGGFFLSLVQSTPAHPTPTHTDTGARMHVYRGVRPGALGITCLGHLPFIPVTLVSFLRVPRLDDN